MLRARQCAAALAVAVWAGGCAYNRAPPGFLPDPVEAQREAFGAWIEVALEPGSGDRVDGELMAVSEDTLWIRVLPDTLRSVPTTAVTRGQVVAYASQHGRMALATVGGTVSTISNGAFLIFTAPLWVLVGTASAAYQSRRPVNRLPPEAWAGLAKFARFPQGMPPGLHRPYPSDSTPGPTGREAPPGEAREPPSEPGLWFWTTGTAALGTGTSEPLASVAGVNVGRGAWSARARYVAWGGVLERPSSSEFGLLLNFRPPRPRWAFAYELALGLGRHQYRSYYPGYEIDPSYGLAFSAGFVWPSPGPVGLKVEAFGNLRGTAPFAGLGLSLELGRRPVIH